MSVEVLKASKNWLIWARESLYFDKKTVARKIHVTEDTLSQWEDTGEIPNNKLMSLAEIYHQNPAIFFNVNNPKVEENLIDFGTIANKKIKLTPDIIFEIRQAKSRR